MSTAMPSIFGYESDPYPPAAVDPDKLVRLAKGLGLTLEDGETPQWTAGPWPGWGISTRASGASGLQVFTEPRPCPHLSEEYGAHAHDGSECETCFPDLTRFLRPVAWMAGEPRDTAGAYQRASEALDLALANMAETQPWRPTPEQVARWEALPDLLDLFWGLPAGRRYIMYEPGIRLARYLTALAFFVLGVYDGRHSDAPLWSLTLSVAFAVLLADLLLIGWRWLAGRAKLANAIAKSLTSGTEPFWTGRRWGLWARLMFVGRAKHGDKSVTIEDIGAGL